MQVGAWVMGSHGKRGGIGRLFHQGTLGRISLAQWAF